MQISSKQVEGNVPIVDVERRSELLHYLSDRNPVHLEYALGLEKPVLFIDLPRRIRNPDWQVLGIEPQEASFRELAGDILSLRQLHEAPDRIKRLLENREGFRQRMQRLRPQMVFNIGNSVQAGALEIARLADKKADERQLREQSHV